MTIISPRATVDQTPVYVPSKLSRDYSPTPTEVDFAQQFADWTVVKTVITGHPISVDVDADGHQWLHYVSLHLAPWCKEFRIRFFEGANTDHEAWMDRRIEQIRAGYINQHAGWDWHHLKSTGQKVLTVAYSERIESYDPTRSVMSLCRAEGCEAFGELHYARPGEDVTHWGKDPFEDEEGRWSIELTRTADGPWEVRTEGARFGAGEVDKFVSDLRWMETEARLLNARSVPGC